MTAEQAQPSTPAGVGELVATHAAGLRPGHPLRVAVDGPPWSELDLAPLVAHALESWSRPALIVRVADFLRPASLRLERGREDPDAFYDDWIDVGGLRREVLDPVGPGGSGEMLPALWDAERDRAARATYQVLPADAVVIVAGWFLLRGDLPFDLTVHVALSPGARARRVPADAAARELPAYELYDDLARPADHADIVVRADDPRRPAVIDRLRRGSR